MLSSAYIDGSIGSMSLDDLIEHLTQTTRLSRPEVERVVAEVVAYFSESSDAFIVRRHAELQAENEKNAAIFDRLEEELRERRFAALPLTQRQIRRLIYG
jgi:hypothetical protein